MNYFSSVSRVIVLFCVIVFTIVLIGEGAFFIFSTKATFENISADNFIQSFWGKLTGVLAVIIGLAFVFAQYLATKKEDCIAFDSPDGEVIIAVSAIEDFVKRLTRSFSEVKDASATVEARDDGVAVEMKVFLWDDKNIQSTTSKIQKTVKSQVQDFFGLENVHHVKVFVMRTVSRAATPEKEAGEEGTPGSEGDETA